MHSIETRHQFTLEFLEDLLGRQTKQYFTTLIICASKPTFLEQIIPPLLEASVEQSDGDNAMRVETLSTDIDAERPETGASHVSILKPILRSLAAAEKVRLVFCPTIAVLRGYLSAYNVSEIAPKECPPPSKTQLVVLDVLALHHGTSEFSLQGLSRIFATAVSAAYNNGSDLKLVECKSIHDPTDPNRGSALWDTDIPLLNRSIKLGGEGTRWAGRLINVKKVAARWFVFEQQPGEDVE